MERAPDSDGDKKKLVLQLSELDFAILEKFRGELSPEAFISALLRMIDSGAVVNKPEWVKDKETK